MIKDKKYFQDYYQKNKEDILAKRKLYYKENLPKIKKYREKNKEKIAKASKQYQEKNAATIKKKAKIWREANPEIRKKQKAEWDAKNKEHKKEYRREWYLLNKDRLIELHKTDKYKKIAKKVRLKRKPKEAEWRKEYMKTPRAIELRKARAMKYAPILNQRIAKRKLTDVNFKLKMILSKRLLQAVKLVDAKKAFKSQKIVGCTIPQWRKHLESQFYAHPKKGTQMTWKNHSLRGWHIDHIKPLSSFDLSIPKEQLRAFNYKNTQPLWAEDNLSKGSKY